MLPKPSIQGNNLMSKPLEKSVSIEDKFLFDLQGFLILRGAIDRDLCAELLRAASRLEAQEFPDEWREKLPPEQRKHRTRDTDIPGQTRLNGLSRLDPVFDEIIAHPAILPYLKEFQGDPQLVNTWCITKSKGCEPGWWHHGIVPEDYRVLNGVIQSPMINVVTMLTPNTAGDGCLLVQPGSHKKNFTLPSDRYGKAGAEVPGAIEVTGEPGDVVLFCEALSHNGGAKSSEGTRTNLYYNHMHSHRSVVMYDRANAHHYWLPPEVRARFNEEQKNLTRWMEMVAPVE